MEQKNNSVTSAETKDEVSANVDAATSSPNNAKPNVGRCCCQISCNITAKWSIYYSDNYEDYTDFCEHHLVDFLPVHKSVKIISVVCQ
jgi:hypothetical protein